MAANFIARTEILIDSSPENVWKSLTQPELIKEYLFGAKTNTDWKTGSLIEFFGNYEGKEYYDKGIIQQVLPQKLLQYTYHSSMSGLEDKPENYFNVTFELEEENGKIRLTLTCGNLPNEDARAHAEKNWQDVLQKIKEVTERRSETVQT